MRRVRLIPISIAAAFVAIPQALPAAVQAQGGPAARCAGITDDAARLACYDRAARGAPVPTTRMMPTAPPTRGAPPEGTPPEGPPPMRTAPGRTVGSWQVLSEPRADGGENLFLLTHATGRRPGAEKPALTINCERGQMTLYVRWQREAGAKIHRVTYTIDGGQPQVMAMAHSKDTYATGLWHPRAAAMFAKRLAGHDRLTMSFNAADGTPMAAVFDISGLGELVPRLQSACRF